MKTAIDSYDVISLGNDLYKFNVTEMTKAGKLGVYVNIRSLVFNITRDNIPMMLNKDIWDLEIEALVEELKAMSNDKIRRFIQTKMSFKKFNL